MGEIFLGGGMSKFSAGGGTPTHFPSRENLERCEIYGVFELSLLELSGKYQNIQSHYFRFKSRV